MRIPDPGVPPGVAHAYTAPALRAPPYSLRLTNSHPNLPLMQRWPRVTN